MQTHWVVCVGALAYRKQKVTDPKENDQQRHVPFDALFTAHVLPSLASTRPNSSFRWILTVISVSAGMVAPPGWEAGVVWMNPPAVGVALMSARFLWAAGSAWADASEASVAQEEKRVRASMVFSFWGKERRKRGKGRKGRSWREEKKGGSSELLAFGRPK